MPATQKHCEMNDQLHAPAGERASGYWIRGWVNPTAGLDTVAASSLSLSYLTVTLCPQLEPSRLLEGFLS
jgi:hypothetical protein